MLLHFDNAPSHNANLVEEFIATPTFERISHPPYSPDLAPSDFGLFGTVKDYFNGRVFESEEELSLQSFLEIVCKIILILDMLHGFKTERRKIMNKSTKYGDNFDAFNSTNLSIDNQMISSKFFIFFF